MEIILRSRGDVCLGPNGYWCFLGGDIREYSDNVDSQGEWLVSIRRGKVLDVTLTLGRQIEGMGVANLEVIRCRPRAWQDQSLICPLSRMDPRQLAQPSYYTNQMSTDRMVFSPVSLESPSLIFSVCSRLYCLFSPPINGSDPSPWGISMALTSLRYRINALPSCIPWYL